MNQSSIQDIVFEMLSEKLGIKRDRISSEKSVNYDLGMDGDDAVEFFFEAFGERFNIDLQPLGYEWDLYFGPEGFSLFDTAGILTLFSARPAPPNGAAIPLPVSRLVDAVLQGHWIPLKEDQ
jgi:acyl carrier protein